ncbi:dihydroneopterin aldolase [bacterium]|nr:dihydroneopterin aldolase [bacterium]
MGIIRMNNMRFYAYHGVSAAEKEVGKHFEVNIEMVTNTAKAASSDNLADTVNYEEVYREVERFITEHKFHLVETLTEKLADILWRKFEIQGIRLRVIKHTPPFPGHLDYIEVEVSRGELR